MAINTISLAPLNLLFPLIFLYVRERDHLHSRLTYHHFNPSPNSNLLVSSNTVSLSLVKLSNIFYIYISVSVISPTQKSHYRVFLFYFPSHFPLKFPVILNISAISIQYTNRIRYLMATFPSIFQTEPCLFLC